MNSLLVTGGAGFIGANFVHYAAAHMEFDKLVVLDALTYAGNANSIDALTKTKRVEFVHGDINNSATVLTLLREKQLNVIVHFAAESHVDRSIHGPDEFVTTNIVGTNTLLSAARQVWITEGHNLDDHRFHHISTDEVYGSLRSDDPMFTESNPFKPNSPYAASKASSDHLVRAYNKTYGLNTCISNCSNNYGPFQFPEKLIPLMIVNILHGKALPIYGDGKNIRDWLHVEDHCRAIDLLISEGRAGQTYNVGGENEFDNLSLVHHLCSAIDRRLVDDPSLAQKYPKALSASGQSSASLISFVKDRAGHDRRYAVDPAKIRKELGFTLRHDFESGINATIDWYLDNSDWWQQVLDGGYREWLNKNYV